MSSVTFPFVCYSAWVVSLACEGELNLWRRIDFARAPSTVWPMWPGLAWLSMFLLEIPPFFYKGGPQPFWHEGPVLWKSIFPQTEGQDGACSVDPSRWQFTVGFRASRSDWRQSSDSNMSSGSGCKYRRSFVGSPPAHLLLSGQLLTGHGLVPGAGDPGSITSTAHSLLSVILSKWKYRLIILGEKNQWKIRILFLVKESSNLKNFMNYHF